MSSTRHSSSSEARSALLASSFVSLKVSAQSTVTSRPKKTEPMLMARKLPSVPRIATAVTSCSKKRTNARYSTMDTASLMMDSPYTSALSDGSTLSAPKMVSVATGSTVQQATSRQEARGKRVE